MINYFINLLNGLGVTITLTVSSLAIGFLLAMIFTLAQFVNNRLIKIVIDGIIFFITGTPLLLQIFLIYFGVGQFDWIRNSYLWFIFRSPMLSAIIALSLNTGCYTAVLLRGAIRSVPHNEIDACSALGMSKWQSLRRIILPRAWQLALPAYGNEVMMMVKSTSLVSTITLLDLMGVGQQIIARTYECIPVYITLGIIYLAINSVIVLCLTLIPNNIAGRAR